MRNLIIVDNGWVDCGNGLIKTGQVLLLACLVAQLLIWLTLNSSPTRFRFERDIT